jgi:hypothetical protein
MLAGRRNMRTTSKITKAKRDVWLKQCSTCLASVRPLVQTPVPPEKKKRKMKKRKERESELKEQEGAFMRGFKPKVTSVQGCYGVGEMNGTKSGLKP